MIICFGELINGAHVIEIHLEDEKCTRIVGNYDPCKDRMRRFPGATAKVDDGLTKRLYVLLHEYFKNKGFNVCRRDETLAKHAKKNHA